MHHKRHALELLELFKQSRQSTPAETLIDPDEVQAEAVREEVQAEAGREEVKVDGFSPMASLRGIANPGSSTSYLPRITPVQKKPSVLNFRKDTIIVGAVFVLVFSGLSFLLGRQTSMTETPEPNVAAAPGDAPLALAAAPALLESPAPALVAKAETASAAPLKVEKEAAGVAEEEAAPPQAYTHIYQVATTYHDMEETDAYRDFLIGNGFDAFRYKTSGKGWWTVKVRSSDKTEGDLKKIKGLPYRGRRPFESAYRLAN